MRFQALQCLTAGVGLSLLFTASCGSGQTPASKIAKSAAQSSRWITHKDSHHYSVESPPRLGCVAEQAERLGTTHRHPG